MKDQFSATLSNQAVEAAADSMGVLAVNDFISKTYSSPKEKREAALSVLRNFPPMLYQPEFEECLDDIGSKKTNDYRALNELLGNSEFRSMVGCSFADQTPDPCTNFWQANEKTVLNHSAACDLQNVLSPYYGFRESKKLIGRN